jgi:DNA invertase Pin-like site-specific DNA recombinase
MTCIIYQHAHNEHIQRELETIQTYLKVHHLCADQTIIDDQDIKFYWNERALGSIIKNAQRGDVIVAFDAANLACSTSQILEIFNTAASRYVSIHFAKYNQSMINDTDQINTRKFVRLISRIESDFISKRTTQALARRRAAGLPLGRPKGRGNKSLKLDKYRSDIKRYLELGISKASIAKLVDCHPQTLYDWLDRNKNSIDDIANQDRTSD